MTTDESGRYYYRHQFDPNQITIVQEEPLTTRSFVHKLISLQVFSACVLVLSAVLQAVAIATNDWFVLNVNEFIPTSKGGLWNYCYVSNSISYSSQFSCMRYENLPNFFVFVTSRLYDSRILLVCSCGFCALLICVEFFGIFSLIAAEKRGDLFDSIVAKRSSRLRADKTQAEYLYPSPGKAKSQARQSSKVIGLNQDEATNSARFTTSIIVNANPELYPTYRTIKPTGYFAYLAIALITMVGSVMDFVLKVSGFALFDAYVNGLLSFNSVFLAYRSYSYWMMIVAMGLLVFFWLFKVFSTRYVVNLTKRLLQARDQLGESEYRTSYDPHFNLYKPAEYASTMKRGYNSDDILVDSGLCDQNQFNAESGYRMVRSYPLRSSFVFDVESSQACFNNAFPADDIISTNSFTSENFKHSYPNMNHNQTPTSYYQEYVRTEPKASKISLKPSGYVSHNLAKPAVEESSDSDQIVYVKRRQETETVVKSNYPPKIMTSSANPIYGYMNHHQAPAKTKSPSISSESTCYI